MENFILILIFSFIMYLIFQNNNNKNRRKKIKYLIHVNGIRGKSTVSRLIDAGLREGGYKVFTKITGTSPRIINTANIEKEILRKGKANIREQIEIIKWAVREKSEILILECMAVNPEFQKVSEKNILKADICVITNVREDHLDEMGKTLDEIAESLANTIPKSAKVFTGDEKYYKFFKKKAIEKKSQIYLANILKEEYEEIDFPSNVSLALEVCKSLGVSEERALEGMKKYKKDSGVFNIFTTKIQDKKVYFINAMAANDPTSTEIILDKIKLENYWKNNYRILLLNNRKDRISRGEQHTKLIKKIEKQFDEIIIFGESRKLLKKIILKENIDENRIRLEKNRGFLEKISENTLIFAIGNICGHGKDLLEFFEEIGGEKEC